MWTAGLLNALLLAGLLTLSHGLLKWVSTHRQATYLETLVEYWWAVGLAMSLYVFIFFYYVYVLRSVPIGYLYPVYTGLSIVFVFAMGAWFFGEPTSAAQIAGSALILVGIFLVTGVGR
ncbi:MAG: SMR family transporter [Gammaproteobacteria bacterium]|nr:SMR family transporter [Gammaproteobacteria bacterium]